MFSDSAFRGFVRRIGLPWMIDDRGKKKFADLSREKLLSADVAQLSFALRGF